jgi:hypothetical protein
VQLKRAQKSQGEKMNARKENVKHVAIYGGIMLLLATVVLSALATADVIQWHQAASLGLGFTLATCLSRYISLSRGK